MKPSLAVIDPPWLWKAYSSKGEDRSPKYNRMTLADISRLPIYDLMANDSVVMLWVVDPLLHQALKIVNDWGFTFKTVGFYWTKHKPSGADHMGGGYYTRANPEQCWVITKGKGLPRVSRSVRRWMHAPVGRHSEKPEEFFIRTQQLFGFVEEKVEIFGRAPREGWTVLGEEIDGEDIFDSLASYKESVTSPCILRI